MIAHSTTIDVNIQERLVQNFKYSVKAMKIDIHTHILPKTWPNLAEVQFIKKGCNKIESINCTPFVYLPLISAMVMVALCNWNMIRTIARLPK